MGNDESVLEKLSRLPKVNLGFFPTPLHKLERLSEKYGVNIFIKRDDFSGISLFGGNKVRKLEHVMGDAIQQKCDTVFTFGATQSNHAMQTATAARRCGLTPILYLVCLVDPDNEEVRANILIDKVLGAEVHFVPKEWRTSKEANEYAAELANQQKSQMEQQGHKCYMIPIGAANPLGSCAYINGYFEMKKQMEIIGIRPDYIFVTSGTGGTLAGLVAGKIAAGSKEKIIGVSATEKPDDYPDAIASLANQGLELVGINAEVTTSDFVYERGYYAPGYEKPNEKANNAIRELAALEGILTDPVYTGKGLLGMLDYIARGEVEKGSNVVFWHTGGATALFAESEIVGSLADPITI